ncbi:MAG TPA: LamG-like jellyroll fold domain-containing protein, partial [Candidatus Binatia bacterium]|nr:LamG-like jellyroll fold domain-containing protein [Candidatus Binatia bacterium]
LDSIGGNNGFLINNASFAPGKVGQAFSLSGSSDAVEILDAPALRPASVTLDAWVMFFSPNGVQSIIAKTVGGGVSDSYQVWLENGYLKGTISDINGASSPVSFAFSPVSGQWYHVAFTFDDSTKQQILYLNGAAVAFGISNLGIGYDTHPLFLGADVDNGSLTSFLQGRIDEATLYNRALGPGEIAAIYNADAAGKTPAGPYFTIPPVLPDAAYGIAYTQMVSTVRGAPSVSYTLTGGSLPPGLTFNSQGLLSGTPTNALPVVPTNAALFTFTIRATDAAGLYADQNFSLRVATPVPPPAGLVSWWRAENNALDSAGTNNGTALNATLYAPGEVGQAFALDGISDCVLIPDSPSLRPASLTIEAWVRFDANTGIQVIFDKPLGGSTLDSFLLWLENGSLKAVISSVNGFGPTLSSPFTPTVAQWYHVAYTFDSATRQQVLYLNNTDVASGLADRNIAYDSNPLLLGGDTDNGTRTFFLKGRIDEAALYNRALTAQEIAGIYYASAAGKTTSGPYFTTLPTLPDAIVNQPYSQSIVSTRGTPTVLYSLKSGSLPPGLTFNSAGLLSGTPTNTGTFNSVVRATDAAGLFAEQFYNVTVYAPVFAPSGLLGWWRGESNALDQLGSHNGTLQGNAAYAPGRVGTAFKLDGVNSYVNLGTWSAGSNWTLEAWVNPSSLPSGRHTIIGSLNNCFDWGLEMTDGQLGVQLRPPGGCSTFLGSGVFPSPNVWYHFTATFDGTNAAVYVNGVLGGTAAAQQNYIGDATGLRIGSSVCCGEYFPGLVDEVTLYNRPLSAAEIASIYNAGPAGKRFLPPLVLLATAQGNTVSLSFPAAIGVTYTVQSETSLNPPSWSVLSNVTALNTNVTVTFPTSGSPQRFYRVITTGN